ncbi:hypothetical protein N9850_12645 [Granulosicoccus sp.]|nr:hypothetical protein [Granulosicoccus sp.]MDB4224613.1 hypothetical protein [Granulosicoccus sp.]
MFDHHESIQHSKVCSDDNTEVAGNALADRRDQGVELFGATLEQDIRKLETRWR